MGQYLVKHGRQPSIILGYVPIIQPAMTFSSSLCQILGWAFFVRVDGLTYSFLGSESLVPGGPLNGTVNFTNIVVTPTQTEIAAQAGPMQVNLTFLSPIEVRFHYFVTFDV